MRCIIIGVVVIVVVGVIGIVVMLVVLVQVLKLCFMLMGMEVDGVVVIDIFVVVGFDQMFFMFILDVSGIGEMVELMLEFILLEMVDIYVYVDYFLLDVGKFECVNVCQFVGWISEGVVIVSYYLVVLLIVSLNGMKYLLCLVVVVVCVVIYLLDQFYVFNYDLFDDQFEVGSDGFFDEEFVNFVGVVGVDNGKVVCLCIEDGDFVFWVKDVMICVFDGLFVGFDDLKLSLVFMIVVNGEVYVGVFDDLVEFLQFVFSVVSDVLCVIVLLMFIVLSMFVFQVGGGLMLLLSWWCLLIWCNWQCIVFVIWGLWV